MSGIPLPRGCAAAMVTILAAAALACSESPPPTLSIAWAGGIESLDPIEAFDNQTWMAQRLIFETLLTYDEGTDLAPLLAETVPAPSADGLTYTFHLRSGVSFVDREGKVLRPIVAADVVQSFNRLLKGPPGIASYYSDIKGAQAVFDGRASSASGIVATDDGTVVFTLEQQDRTFLNQVALPPASIVPPERASDARAFAEDPVGTGPYLLEKYSPEQGAIFRRNPHYWAAGSRPERIDFRLHVSPKSALQQIQAGTLDLMGDSLPGAADSPVVKDARYAGRVFHQSLVETQYVFMDWDGSLEPALAEPKVRQALEWAIDKEHIVRDLTHGAGDVADCVFPPALPGHDESCAPYGYDQDTARRLLKEAGFQSGFKTEFYTDTGEPSPTIAQAIAADLKEIGVEVKVVAQPKSMLLTTMARHAAPMGWTGWLQDYPDPADFIDPLFSCTSAQPGQTGNPGLYCNHALDSPIKEARGEADRAKWTVQYSAIQRQIMADAAIVPVRHPQHWALVSPRVRGFAIHPVWLYDLASFTLAT